MVNPSIHFEDGQVATNKKRQIHQTMNLAL